MRISLVVVCAVVASLAGIFVSRTDGLAVMSLDLGSEWMKIALVKPGVPMEIILNRESRRKTPVVVAMKDSERTIGDPALVTARKYPQNGFFYFGDLVGKNLENPLVQEFKKRFPYYDLVEDPEKGTVAFKDSEANIHTPEELLAMLMNSSRDIAQDFAEQPIKDIVITVPSYYNQAERKAILEAASLVGLNVLQIINDNTAVALNYGVFRRASFNTTESNIMFYDMGAASTTATIVAYQLVKTRESGITETYPQLTIRGVGFDRTFGGLEIDMRLRNHLAAKFNEQGLTKNDVTKSPRSMAKLLKEAKRVKEVLSANTEFYAQIEGLLDDKDFRQKVTREELEEMCTDLLDRVKGPIDRALKITELSMSEIDQVILVGGGTRIPKIQEILLNIVKKEDLGKNINADEAAAMGASYQAAYLSKGFKVKKFGIKDLNPYPIAVDFERVNELEDGTKSVRVVKRTLFGLGNNYPQKKVMTFHRQKEDFTFNVNYGDLDFLTEEELRIFGATNLSTVNVGGVKEALEKNTDKDEKGIKAHFRMDENGILNLDEVESVFEKMPAENETEREREKSTFEKIGNTISSFFGSSDKENEDKADVQTEEDTPEPKEAAGEPGKSEGESTDEPASDKETGGKDDEGSKEGEKKEEEKKEDDKKTEESKEKEQSSEDKKPENEKSSKDPEKPGTNETVTNTTAGEESSKKKKKPMVVKEAMTVDVKRLDAVSTSQEKIDLSKKKLDDLRQRDQKKLEREKAQNELESFIFDTQDKLYQDLYMAASTEEERTELGQKLSETSDWLWDDGAEAETEAYKTKLKELKKSCKELFFRVKEKEDRTLYLEAMKNLLNSSSYFMVATKNMTGEGLIYTEVEISTLEKLHNDTRDWRDKMVAEQASLPDTQTPVLLTEDIRIKAAALDREIQYLVNKAKYYKPPKPKKTKAANDTMAAGGNETVKETPTTRVNETVKETPTAGANETVKETPTAGANETVKETPTAGANETVKETPTTGANETVKETPTTGTNETVKETPTTANGSEAGKPGASENGTPNAGTEDETPTTTEAPTSTEETHKAHEDL